MNLTVKTAPNWIRWFMTKLHTKLVLLWSCCGACICVQVMGWLSVQVNAIRNLIVRLTHPASLTWPPCHTAAVRLKVKVKVEAGEKMVNVDHVQRRPQVVQWLYVCLSVCLSVHYTDLLTDISVIMLPPHICFSPTFEFYAAHDGLIYFSKLLSNSYERNVDYFVNRVVSIHGVYAKLFTSNGGPVGINSKR